jgi:hypothetical protein
MRARIGMRGAEIREPAEKKCDIAGSGHILFQILPVLQA